MSEVRIRIFFVHLMICLMTTDLLTVICLMTTDLLTLGIAPALLASYSALSFWGHYLFL